MDPKVGGHGPPANISPDSLPLFAEAVHLVLSRWTALQLAVENEWGGRNSRQKFEQLAADILSWFTTSKDTLYIDELETMLDEGMVLSFNAEIEDGSIEEVAEQLMTVHEEWLHGKFETLFKLRTSNSRGRGVSESRQVVDENVDDRSDEDDNLVSEMELETNAAADGSSVSAPSSEIRIENEGDAVNKNHNHASHISLDLNRQQSGDAADGWTIVSSKRNHGRKLR